MYWGHQVGEGEQEESRGVAMHIKGIRVSPGELSGEEQGGNLGLFTTRVF